MLTHLKFSIERYGNVAIFFSPSPLEFHNFFRVFRYLDELSITIHDFKVMSHIDATNWHETTNRLIE